MKKSILGILCFSLILITGCSQINKQFASSSFTPPIYSGIIADLNIGHKIQGTASCASILNFFPVGLPENLADGVSFHTGSNVSRGMMLPGFQDVGPISKLKKAALYNALDGTKYEYILNPRYKIIQKNYFIYATYTITVKGWGASVQKFRTLTDKQLLPKQ